MPLIASTYSPTLLFKNAHINTVYKTLFYSNSINYNRIRIATPDADFLDLDFSMVQSDTLVIALHGLEGSSNSKYIISLINHLNNTNIDCVGVNFRGCSGEDNNHIFSYNSGKTDDLQTVISYILNNYTYKNIVLVGYSMGGNIALKFLGENNSLPSQIKGAATISVPTNLAGSSMALAKPQNYLYMKRFLKTLIKKGLSKNKRFPNSILDSEKIKAAKNFTDFDNAVTAPLFGYKNAEDYWTHCSSKQFIPSIIKPTLIINALDDTFLNESCFPFSEAKLNSNVFLETPKYGGHVGFNTTIFTKDQLWSENRISSFINHIIS